MMALWISLAVAVVLVLAWRIRVASRKLDRILREEREFTETESESAEHPVERP